jgi:hypothetical protein
LRFLGLCKLAASFILSSIAEQIVSEFLPIATLIMNMAAFAKSRQLLTTWLMPETLDWRIVTASPIEGFEVLLLLAMAEARKARVCRELSD